MLGFNPSQRAISENNGKIRVQVKLINEFDEALVARGLLNPDQIHILETEALVDPTSTRTYIPREIVEKLDLPTYIQETVKSSDGEEETVVLAAFVIIQTQGRETGVPALVGGDEIVIGRTALETLDFVVDYENQRLIPNPKHPDYPIFRI